MSSSPAGSLIAGLDVGGTKAHLVVVDAVTGAGVLDRSILNPGWSRSTDEQRAAALLELTRTHLPPEVVAVVAGVHGSDSPHQQHLLKGALGSAYPIVDVVNDSELLIPAAGAERGTGVTAGTGSSATSTTPQGASVTVGGWGWVLGDEGGAVGLVRDAAKEILAAHDLREQDLLSTMLLDALELTHPHALGLALSTTDTRVWASVAPVVFDAAAAGSPRARRVLDAHARALAGLLDVIRTRGGDLTTVVAGGGVMVNQPGFFDAFSEAALATLGQHADVRLLTQPPAIGGLALARRLLEAQPADLTWSTR